MTKPIVGYMVDRAATADKWSKQVKLKLTGDVKSTETLIDGSGDVSLEVVLDSSKLSSESTLINEILIMEPGESKIYEVEDLVGDEYEEYDKSSTSIDVRVYDSDEESDTYGFFLNSEGAITTGFNLLKSKVLIHNPRLYSVRLMITITGRIIRESEVHDFIYPSDAIPPLSGDSITSGVFDIARIPNISADKIDTGVLGIGRIPGLNANKIGSGILPITMGGYGTGNIVTARNYLGLTNTSLTNNFVSTEEPQDMQDGDTWYQIED